MSERDRWLALSFTSLLLRATRRTRLNDQITRLGFNRPSLSGGYRLMIWLRACDNASQSSAVLYA